MNLPHPELYGLLGEFDSPERLMDAAKKVREAGYRRIDAFVPFPVEGLSHALGLGRKQDLVPLLTLAGGLGGGLTGFFFRLSVNDIRTDRARCLALRCVWYVGAEQAAAAASPVV